MIVIGSDNGKVTRVFQCYFKIIKLILKKQSYTITHLKTSLKC